METFTRWQDPTIEEYKQLIKNWKEKYYQMKEERNKQQEVLNRLKVVYTSMQFSAPENMYTFVEQMGDLLEEIE